MFKKLRGALVAATATLVAVAGVAAVTAPPASATGQTWVCCGITYVHPNLPWKVAPAPHNLTSVNSDLIGSGCVDAINVNGGAMAGGTCVYDYGGPGWVVQPYCGCQSRTGVVRPYIGYGSLTQAQIWW
jgi:hypothetical protein